VVPVNETGLISTIDVFCY